MHAALRAVHLLRDDERVDSTTELDKATSFSNLDAPVSEHGKVRTGWYSSSRVLADI